MTNTRNTPVEALERDLPVRVRSYTLRVGSAGVGRVAGGEGVVREIEALAPLEVALLSERRRSAPKGLTGGGDGAVGRNTHILASGEELALPGKWVGGLAPGESIRLESPGGGAIGEPAGEAP